jgi:NAD+ kinase
MDNAFKCIGLIGKYGDPGGANTVLDLSRILQERGCEVILEDQTAEAITDHQLPAASQADMATQCDLVITVGGDGTLLNASRNLVDHNVPILGVNLGRLGFLVDVSPEEIHKRMNEILDGKFEEEHRIMLTTTIERHDGTANSVGDALNDTVIHKWEVARMIETETYINGKFVNNMRSDGLIISTPTGSTAYALSAGGPILEPDMQAMIIVPICPHTMSYRPIVIDGESEIEIYVKENPHSHAQVTCDGQINLGVVSGDKVHIQKKDKFLRLIHPCKHDHYHILREKLHWGGHSN